MKIRVSNEQLANIVVDLTINDSLHQSHKEGAPIAYYGVDHTEFTENTCTIFYIQSGGYPSDNVAIFETEKPILKIGTNELVEDILGVRLSEYSYLAEELYNISEKEILQYF